MMNFVDICPATFPVSFVMRTLHRKFDDFSVMDGAFSVLCEVHEAHIPCQIVVSSVCCPIMKWCLYTSRMKGGSLSFRVNLCIASACKNLPFCTFSFSPILMFSPVGLDIISTCWCQNISWFCLLYLYFGFFLGCIISRQIVDTCVSSDVVFSVSVYFQNWFFCELSRDVVCKFSCLLVLC